MCEFGYMSVSNLVNVGWGADDGLVDNMETQQSYTANNNNNTQPTCRCLQLIGAFPQLAAIQPPYALGSRRWLDHFAVCALDAPQQRGHRSPARPVGEPGQVRHTREQHGVHIRLDLGQQRLGQLRRHLQRGGRSCRSEPCRSCRTIWRRKRSGARRCSRPAWP